MDENASSQDQDFSKLSIEDRVTHKNWKARISGYEELTKLFPQCEDREFQRYAPLVKKFVIDSNAAAQEKGLAATLAFVDYCPTAGKYVENIVAGVATKCLTSNRAKTKELASNVVMMCVEIEKQDVVVEELIKAMEQKTPKNVAATISMLRKCLNRFGYKVINVKTIVPVLARLLEERDQNVREETKQLTIEIYRWIKDALLPQLSSLKPILIQELQVEFEKYKDTKALPERLLRSQQQRQQGDETDGNAMSGDGNIEVGVDEEPDAQMDPFDLMEPVDILTKLPSDFYTLLEAKKWSERKDGLEKLQQLLEANPKLVTTVDYGELVKQLRKIISKDTNIVVATMAIKCMAQLAQGLRKNFHNHANPSIPILLEKFKEKKQNVVQALREAIDAVYLSTNLEAISEDIVAALDNKNPSIRSETALFLARSFAKTNPHLIQKKLLKTLTTSLIKTLSDSDANVRESSAEALGTALKAQGDRNMIPFLQSLEGLKMAKIEEFRTKVEVKKFAPPPPASVPSITAKPSSNSNFLKPKTAPVKKAVPGSKASSAKQVNYNLSDESLNDSDQQLPSSTATMKIKPKASGGQIKSRLGTGTNNNSEGGGSLKPIGIRAGVKTTNGSRLGTLAKGSVAHQSNSSLPSMSTGTSSTSVGGSSSGKKDQDSGPLMNGNLKAKEQRFADEKALKVLKWNFTTPREEFYHLLREQMTNAEWQSQLICYCFHSDFKYHIKAIDLMREFFQKSSTEDNPIVVANLDLVLKWIALRFFDTNPSVITKALELLMVVFGLCVKPYAYTLSDIEANSFLPYLVLKVGDPKDAVRNKVHDILARMKNIYPANRIFAHLFTGLQSKNARQRAACLEEISQLIELRGMSIFNPPNSLQLIKDLAKFIAERDNAVRNGALSCIVQVYFLEGERVFKLIGSLSDKEMSLVEERIKRASKNRASQPQIAAAQSQVPQHSHSASHLPETIQSSIPTQSSLPTLTSAVSGNTPRLNNHIQTPEASGRGMTQIVSSGRIPAVSDLTSNDTEVGGGYGLSKFSTYTVLQSGANVNSPQQPSYEIGATFSKSRSASSVLKRGSTGGNFVMPSRLFQSPQQLRSLTPNNNSTKFTSDETTFDSEDQIQIQNYSRNTTSIDSYILSAPEGFVDQQQSEIESSDYSTTTDDELDQKVKQALNLPDIKLVRRYYRNSAPISNRCSNNSSDPSSTNGSDTDHNFYSPQSSHNNLHTRNDHYRTMNPVLNQRFVALFAHLSSTELPVAIEAMEQMNTALKDLPKNQRYLEPKIDQLIILCNKQFRLFLSKHYPKPPADEAGNNDCDNNNNDDNGEQMELETNKERRLMALTLFRSTASVLNKLFRCSMGKRVSRDTLRELLAHLLSYFVEMRSQENIFNSVNFLINVVLQGSDATNLFAALIRMLHDYVGSTAVEHLDKYLDITMKFLWRVTKMLERYICELNVDQILYECHLFFKSYPRNWWKVNNRKDIPLRTIKTLIYFIVELKGEAIFDHFTLIQNKDESELSYYAQKALRQKCDKLIPKNTSTNNHSLAMNNLSTSSGNTTLTKTTNTSSVSLVLADLHEHNSSAATTVKSSPLIVPNGNVPKENTGNSANINQRKIPELAPRTTLKNFPLKVRQINTENGETTQIPIIQNEEDLKTYVDYTAKQLNIPELNYEKIKAKEREQHRTIRSVEDAQRAVELAKQRLNHFKLFLNWNGSNHVVEHRSGTSPSSSS